MPVDKKSVEEFEEKYKEILFGEIEKLHLKQTELIEGIGKQRQYIELEENLPNIGITLNNKIIELQHQFEDAGISMYSEKIEDYGPLKLNFVGPSLVGKAIIYDLIKYASDATRELESYDRAMGKLIQKKEKEVQALEKTTPIKRFFAKIRKFIIPAKKEPILYTAEETDMVNAYLLKYKKIDKQLWNYNIKENVVDSIVKQFKEERYEAYRVPGLLNESINPHLQKLGLEHLIPQLQEKLIKEYEKALSSEEKSQILEEDMFLYIPEFDNKQQDSNEIDFNEVKKLRDKYHNEKDDEIEL